MKTATTYVTLLLFCGIGSASAQLPANPLEGSWKLVSQMVIYPDTTIDRGSTLNTSYKILNSTHFAFGRMAASEEEVYAGGGRYTYDGTHYTEHIEYHSSAPLVGTSITFDVRIEGDRWYHSGQIGDFRLEEVWERIGAVPAQ